MKTDELLKKEEANSDEGSVSSAEEQFASEEVARKVFSRLKSNLLKIEEWNKHSLMSSYELFDEKGNVAGDGKLAVDLLIRVKISASGKNDWIRIVDFYEADDEFVLTVKPCADPTREHSADNTVSHFFTDESTNNFCIVRKNKTVAFYVIGLDEKANTKETSGVLETVRNAAVNLATYLGMQKGEWTKFCRHFLYDAEETVNSYQLTVNSEQ